MEKNENMTLELFVSDNCPKCERVKKLLLGQNLNNSAVVFRNINKEPEAMTDLIMAGFLTVPILKAGDSVVHGDHITEEKIRELIMVKRP